MNAGLEKCPFCACEMRLISFGSRQVLSPTEAHDQMCILASEKDFEVAGGEDFGDALREAWNWRAGHPNLAQEVAEREQRIAALERRLQGDAKIMHDLLVGNQAAWIEWQRGAGAEAAMTWVQNSLMGVGVPDEGAPWATEPQAWWDANKAEPFPTCFCGRPSNWLSRGRGFCGEAHMREAEAKEAAEAAGKTGLPLFDGTSPDTEGGACD